MQRKLPKPLTFDELLYQRAAGALVGTVHDTVGYPRQVSHVAVPSSSLGPDRGEDKHSDSRQDGEINNNLFLTNKLLEKYLLQ